MSCRFRAYSGEIPSANFFDLEADAISLKAIHLLENAWSSDADFTFKPGKIPRSPLGMTAFKRSVIPNPSTNKLRVDFVRDLEQTELLLAGTIALAYRPPKN